MAVVAVLLLVVVAAGSSEAGAERSRIVFWSDRDRAVSGDIFIMDQDGSNLTNLTKDWSKGAFFPEVSPDGRRIAFSARTDVHPEIGIWLMDIDGSHPQKVTDDRIFRGCLGPSWSPDGSRLVFSAFSDVLSKAPGCDGMGSMCWFDLYIVDLGSRGIATDLGSREIVRLTRDPMTGYYPAWSPDGRRVAFVRDDPLTSIHTGGLWVVDVDGTNLRQLTAAGRAAEKPSWSPDGSRILYYRIDQGELSVIDADGAGSPVNLFNDGRWGGWPAWSPDGSKIAYLYRSNIWLMDAESTISVQLTHGRDARGGSIAYGSISWTPGTVGSAVRNSSWGRLKASVKD